MLLHQQVRNVAGTIFQVSQNLYHFLDHMVCYSSLCCHFPDCNKSILSDQIINFFFALPGTGSLQETQRGWLAVSVFLPTECFTHHLTLLVPMHTSPYSRWSHAWISDVGTSSFTKNLITESCQHSLSLSTIFSCWNMTTWQRQTMWFSF